MPVDKLSEAKELLGKYADRGRTPVRSGATENLFEDLLKLNNTHDFTISRWKSSKQYLLVGMGGRKAFIYSDGMKITIGSIVADTPTGEGNTIEKLSYNYTESCYEGFDPDKRVTTIPGEIERKRSAVAVVIEAVLAFWDAEDAKKQADQSASKLPFGG